MGPDRSWCSTCGRDDYSVSEFTKAFIERLKIDLHDAEVACNKLGKERDELILRLAEATNLDDRDAEIMKMRHERDTARRFLAAEQVVVNRLATRNIELGKVLGITYPGYCDDEVWGCGALEATRALIKKNEMLTVERDANAKHCTIPPCREAGRCARPVENGGPCGKQPPASEVRPFWWQGYADEMKATIATLTAERDAAVHKAETWRDKYHTLVDAVHRDAAEGVKVEQRLTRERDEWQRACEGRPLQSELAEARRSGLTLTAVELAGLTEVRNLVSSMLDRAEHNGNRGSSAFDGLGEAVAYLDRLLTADAAARGGA